MPICQFGERQYELAANLELLGRNGQFFVPTPVLESKLGIDIALAPGSPRIWSLLNVAPPPGVRLGPSIFRNWPHRTPPAARPPFLVSLFLQYKRSTYLTRKNAKEWTHHNEPYWRISLTSHQHQLLRELELAVAVKGVVRYAAPLFWQYSELWIHQASGGVLDRSLFASPEDVAAHHTRLSWSPANGLKGHSTPESLPGEDSADLARAVIAKAAAHPPDEPVEDARTHIRALADALEQLDPPRGRRKHWQRIRAARGATREALTRDETVEAAIDMAMIMEASSRINADWLLIELNEPTLLD